MRTGISGMLLHTMRASALLFLLSGVVCAKDSGPEFPSTEGWYFQYVTGATLGEYITYFSYSRPFMTPASQNISVEYYHSKEGRIARFSTRDGVVVMEILEPLAIGNDANYWLKGVNRAGYIDYAHKVSFYLETMLPGVLFERWRDSTDMETNVTSATIRKKRMDKVRDTSVVRFQKSEFVSGRIEKYRTRSFEMGTTYGMENKGVWPDDVLSDGQMDAIALDNPFAQTVTFTYTDNTSQWPGQWIYVAKNVVKTVGRLISAKPIPPELTYAKVKEEWTRGLKPVLRGGFDKKEAPKRPVVQYLVGGVLLFLSLLGGVWYYRRGREE